MGNLFPMLLTQKQLSLSTRNVLKFVCTVIQTVKFYEWIILHIESIDLFSLRIQEGNASVNLTE